MVDMQLSSTVVQDDEWPLPIFAPYGDVVYPKRSGLLVLSQYRRAKRACRGIRRGAADICYATLLTDGKIKNVTYNCAGI